MGGAKAHYDCIKVFSETDLTEDLKKIDVPVLIMHSEDDQMVPYADSAPLAVKLLKHGTLKTYKGPAARLHDDAPGPDQRGHPRLRPRRAPGPRAGRRRARNGVTR